MALDASLDAALQGAAPLVCLLVKIELPDHTIRVVDGAGSVSFPADTITTDNLYDTAAKQTGFLVSSTTGNLTANPTWSCTDWIPVTAGAQYTINANATKRSGLSFFSSYGSTTCIAGTLSNTATLPLTVTAPVGATHMVVNVKSVSIPEPSEIMINAGASALPYAPMFQTFSYLGEDEDYGVLDNVETLTEQVGTEAPMLRLTFLPSSLDALADIRDPANQGSAVSVWFGAVSQNTGALIGEPEQLFIGELDTAEIEVSAERTAIIMNMASAWERLFDASEGQRLNNAFLQSIYSGALGAEFVIAIQRDLPWGYDGPRPAVVSDVTGGSTGRGGTAVGGGFGGGFDRRMGSYP